MNKRDFERREKARQDAMFDAQFADEPTSDVEYADEPPCKTGSQCTNKCQRCGEINPAEIHTCSPEPQVNGWPLYSGLPKLIKPTQEQVIAWAREAGLPRLEATDEIFCLPSAISLATLAYEAGRESAKLDSIHTCHDQCQRPACVAVREAYEAGRKDENEACAEVCEEIARLYSTDIFPEDGTSIDCNSAKMGRVVTRNCAQSIRARREQ